MMEKIGIFVVAMVVLVVPMALLNGWVVMLLWEWFIVPVTNLRVLVFGEALGVSLVISYMTMSLPDMREKSTAETFKTLGWVVGRPFLALAVAWVYLAVFF